MTQIPPIVITPHPRRTARLHLLIEPSLADAVRQRSRDLALSTNEFLHQVVEQVLKQNPPPPSAPAV